MQGQQKEVGNKKRGYWQLSYTGKQACLVSGSPNSALFLFPSPCQEGVGGGQAGILFPIFSVSGEHNYRWLSRRSMTDSLLNYFSLLFPLPSILFVFLAFTQQLRFFPRLWWGRISSRLSCYLMFTKMCLWLSRWGNRSQLQEQEKWIGSWIQHLYLGGKKTKQKTVLLFSECCVGNTEVTDVPGSCK